MTPLEKYGSHKQTHGPWGGPCRGAPCHCGFTAAIRAAQIAEPPDSPDALPDLSDALKAAEDAHAAEQKAHAATRAAHAGAQADLTTLQAAHLKAQSDLMVVSARLALAIEALQTIATVQKGQPRPHFVIENVVRTALGKLAPEPAP